MRNKKFISLILMALLAFNVFAATTTVINQPAATVRLIRNEVISYQDLQNALDAQNVGSEYALQVLDILINNAVFLQGAERDGIKLTDAQLNQLVAQQKANIEQQAGSTLTTDQFNELVVNQFGSMDTFKKQLKEQYIMQAYLVQEKGEELEANIAVPTDAEIRAFYRKNQTQFVQAENVKLAHIYIDKTDDDKTNANNKAKLEQAYNEIKSGKLTFEAAVNKYSEDEESKSLGGEIGWLSADNTVAFQGWGEEFCNTVLSLNVGEVSPVLESSTGYHIVRISVHNDAKMLSLTDRISPDTTVTVYQYIQQGLYSQNSQVAMANALNEMVENLRKQATIRILYK